MKKNKFSIDKQLFIGCSLSFILPLFSVFIGYYFKGIAPFGERTLCSMDGFSQYYPMLENMSEAIKEGELFYSFNGALGFNLWAQSAYYTNSPLWALIYILPHSAQLVGINLLVALKFSLASVFFFYRIHETHNKADTIKKCVVFPILSVCYGISGYMLAFANQFMWADVVMLLPLVIFGLEKLYKGQKPYLYIITLFLCMWSCFYLSYMVCLFVCLYFLYLTFREKEGFRTFFKKGVSFALYSILSAALAAVVLLPVYKALSLTLASELGFEGTVDFKYTLKEMLIRLLPFQEPSLEYAAPNLYFGLGTALLLVLSLFTRKISLRKKLLSAAFLLFMLVTMSLNLGEFIWHGFHYPNQLPGRQSFLFIFLALSFTASFIAVCSLKKVFLVAVSAVLFFEVSLNTCGQLGKNVWASLSSSLRRFDYTMSQFTELDNDSPFMRIEWADVNKNNYPQQYAYKGVTYYSSTMSGDSYNFFQHLGIPRYAKNVSVYYYQSDITNALFGIEYILQADGFTVYRNENALPLAFAADKEILSFDLYSHPVGYEAQQALWLSLVGEDELNLSEQANKLQSQGMAITEFDTDLIKGNITVGEDSVLFTTIPFDGGWKFYIDGKEVPVIKVTDYLCAAEISRGEHEIVMKYTVPGIIPGAVISGVAVAAFALLVIVKKKKELPSARM